MRDIIENVTNNKLLIFVRATVSSVFQSIDGNIGVDCECRRAVRSSEREIDGIIARRDASDFDAW